MNLASPKHALGKNGFVLVPGLIDPAERQHLIDVLGNVDGGGRRGLLAHPLVAKVATSPNLLDLLRPHLPAEPLPVRAILFDKSPRANWLVTWHQDLCLAVQAKVEIPGFGAWSVKDGAPHVQPPTHILERMLTVRVHLDDCDESNGALRVLPGTHALGRLSPEEIQNSRKRIQEFLCRVPAGDALLMRPLLLHASGRSRSGWHRRILHIEYAGFTLPDGLEWYESYDE